MLKTKKSTLAANSEFKHLVKLLDDEDENIYSNVRDRFLSYGNQTSEFLRNYVNDENILIKKRASEIISILNFEKIENDFKELPNSNGKSFLEDAIFNIAEFGYPGIDKNHYKKRLDEMALKINIDLMRKNSGKKRLTALEILNTVNNELFDVNGFQGNSDNYYNADNSYINKVLDNKKGIPISLSLIYLFIAKRLELPVFGINLPGHFILKYSGTNEEFFIDPFNKGVIISINEAKEFVKKIGMSNEDFDKIPYLKKANDKEIVLRVLRNLIEVYDKENNSVKTKQLEKLMQCLV